ncbi:hypothetical protein EON65_51330, partial [archaeon]
MHIWLFCFQKSVALVLTHILDAKAKKASFLQAELEDRTQWVQDTCGHGRYQNLLRRHAQGTSASAGGNRAYTLEDLGSVN